MSVLLVHSYDKLGVSCNLIMESLVPDITIIDIKATIPQHCNIAKYLPAGHALTDCDAVYCLYRIGKVTRFILTQKRVAVIGAV